MANKFKKIAIHLPQFHPTAENDQWWGKGFTEWTNVTRAQPLFNKHYQPHLPADLGFYDLRLEEARLAQEALAKQYDVYGFCYYHYWFNGKRILNEPVDRKLNNLNEDLPFMLCWANENWTRRWDGGDSSLLMEQSYNNEDDLNHIRHLLRYFNDPRYIRVDNKPVFVIYKSYLFPNIKQTIEIWRNEALKVGVELYLIKFEHYNLNNTIPQLEGFDASAEFQPWSPFFENYLKEVFQKNRQDKLSYFFKHNFYRITRQWHLLKKMRYYKSWQVDYRDYIQYLIDKYEFPHNYLRYPSVVPSWDNTARRGADASYFFNSSPQLFKEWLQHISNKFIPPSNNENFIFINAWNEWAEGNHLEPCQKWGSAYLESLRSSNN